MKRARIAQFAVAGAAVGAWTLGSAGAAGGANHRLSLPPQGAHLFGTAVIAPSGYSGHLALAPQGTPGFSMGFTLPHDYAANTPLNLAVIVDSASTGCAFVIRGAALVRARAGHPGDRGSADAGLEALSASTPFSTADNKRNLIFAAPAAQFTGARFNFRIVPTPGEFPNLGPGDAILFRLVRLSDSSADTCDTHFLNVGGVSVIYTLRKTSTLPAKARLPLDPFHAFSSEAEELIEWNDLEPPLRLEDRAAENEAGFGFVVPEDQKANTPVEIELLWSSPEPGCSFVVASNYLFRSRVGRNRDHASAGTPASAGLEPVSASTPFHFDGSDLVMAAPEEAHRVARLVFRISAASNFPNLKPGDAVSLGIFRRFSDPADTCAADLEVAGVSVLYERKTTANARGALVAEAGAKRRAISFNPYALAASSHALDREDSGFEPAVSFRGGSSASEQSDFATGFVVPDDYKTNSPLTLALSFAAQETNCSFELFSNGLFRARPKHPRDFGNAAGGLIAKGATTPFTNLGAAIAFQAPATAGKTARVEFEIVPTPDEFPTLKAGDAVNFGVFRRPGSALETCAGPLGIAGISVLYTPK